MPEANLTLTLPVRWVALTLIKYRYSFSLLSEYVFTSVKFIVFPEGIMGWDSSVAAGWTVRGSNPGGRQDFPRPSKPTGDHPIFLYTGYRVLPGGKLAGAWR